MSERAKVEALLDAAAESIGLTVPEAYREGVLGHLAIAAEMAEVVDKAPLDAREFALAPTYGPPLGEPDGDP